MGRANRSFSSINQPTPGVPGFNPGGADFGVVRMVDGHDPFRNGIEGSNVHQPSAGDPMWHDIANQYEVEGDGSDCD